MEITTKSVSLFKVYIFYIKTSNYTSQYINIFYMELDQDKWSFISVPNFRHLKFFRICDVLGLQSPGSFKYPSYFY